MFVGQAGHTLGTGSVGRPCTRCVIPVTHNYFLLRLSISCVQVLCDSCVGDVESIKPALPLSYQSFLL